MQRTKRSWLTLSLMIALAVTTTVAGARAAVDAEQEIREAVEQFITAYGTNDVEKYFSFFASDVTQWWPNGRRIDRQTYYDMWTRTVAEGGGYESFGFDDLQIHAAPSGDSGVASYALKLTRRNAPPERATSNYRMSVTLVKRNVGWQVVHFHFNSVSPPSNPRSAAELDVRDTINRLTANYGVNDIDGYFFFFAPELTWWGPGGRNSKEGYRQFWTDNIDRTGGLESAENSDLQVQVSPSGDLAVASYLLTVKNKNPGSGDRTVRWQMSPTLIKRNGLWKIVHLHFQRDPD